MNQDKPLYRVTRHLKFCSAHQLKGLPDDHPCSRMHGHNYKAEVTLEATSLDDTGFIIDFNIIKQVVEGKYDHQCLNEVMRKNPTAEHIAEDIGAMMHELVFRMEAETEVRVVSVKVVETDNCEALITYPDFWKKVSGGEDAASG